MNIVISDKKDIKFVLEGSENNKDNIYLYDNIIKYLNDFECNNKMLLINKFTNIFKLNEDYLPNEDEKKILIQVKKNNELIKKDLGNRFECLNFQAPVNDKLIIGLGNQSVFETDITLHGTYGIPYIPGSTLKGVFRNYIIQEYFKECIDKCDSECNKECEKNANKDSLFVKIFGGENANGESVQGRVIFMDSFPNTNYKIKRDIMTPHHKQYYVEENKLPLDSDDTNPINFLVVQKNKNNEQLKFEFTLAIDKNISSEKILEEDDINKKISKKYVNKTVYNFILENILDALNFYGIGAKTSVGYGYFDVDNKQVIKELERERKKKLKEEELVKKQKEKEKEFKEATKNMSEFQIEIYKIDRIGDKDKKNKSIMDFYNKIDELESDERIQLATYMKGYLQKKDKWKIKKHKSNKKKDKVEQRIKKICEILNIELPINDK